MRWSRDYPVQVRYPAPPDGSRDVRIEDFTNRFVIHPVGRLLLPTFLRLRVSANAVSIGGLFIGALTALAFGNWGHWPAPLIGLALAVCWLVADGLDGMIARATKTASALGRFLDGLCDHGVFALIYIALAISIGTKAAWALAITAGIFHAFQSNLYEGERARFHRRVKGIAAAAEDPTSSAILRSYDRVTRLADFYSKSFDLALRLSRDPKALAKSYGEQAARPMLLMSLLSANTRIWVVFAACTLGQPELYWWIELSLLNLILIAGLLWHKSVTMRLTEQAGSDDTRPG
jgi:CDP-diacylglycerol---serine O-phosphatidyltransferase